jgi:predicted amino acid dehydrogenase
MSAVRSVPSAERPQSIPRFAFVVHALGGIHRRIMGFRAARPSLLLGLQRGTRPEEVLTVCELGLPGQVRGIVVGVPMAPTDLLADQERALTCMSAAVEYAGRVDAVGLGSLCAVVAGRGDGLAERCKVPVTNGGAATAWAIVGNVHAVLERVGRDRPVAVIGSRGPVGGVVAELLAADGIAVRVDHPRAARGRDVAAADDPERAVAGCRVVVGAGATGRVLPAGALADDAVVVDVALRGTVIGRPGPGVRVLAGEAVELPPSWARGGWGWLYHVLAGYGPTQAFACLIEPLVIAVTGRETPFSIGRQLNVESVHAFGRGAAALGFKPRLARGWFAFDPERIPRQIPAAPPSG